MQTTAVYACVRILAETIASLPLHTYMNTENGKEKARGHPIYHLLADSPNPEMTSFVFRETLMGPAVKNKGMALFPRKVNGRYMMLGRQDNESLYLMQSDNLFSWHEYQPLAKPTYDWELTQIGNCGSPIEIDEGWLVITHGVGPVRTYSLGALLLDKNDPCKVIRRMDKPLITPAKHESSGYVPNVIYTCGAMVIDRTLILPYAIADVVTTFATISVDEIINSMKKMK